MAIGSQYSLLGDDGALIFGAKAGYNFDRKFSLAASIYNLPFRNIVIDPPESHDETPYLKMNIYGVEGEYFLMKGTQNFSIGIFAGRGEFKFNVSSFDEASEDTYAHNGNFTAIMPFVSYNYVIRPWLRLSATGGYRFTNGAEYDLFDKTYTGSDLDGIFLGLIIGFGNF
ncbi:MAG: hypothetical protein ACLFR2_04735 [Candidatus Kapaibacterium sp.]